MLGSGFTDGSAGRRALALLAGILLAALLSTGDHAAAMSKESELKGGDF